MRTDAEYFAEAMHELDEMLGHDTRALVRHVEDGPLGAPRHVGHNLTGWSLDRATQAYRHTSGAAVDAITLVHCADPVALLEHLADRRADLDFALGRRSPSTGGTEP